MSGTFWHMFVHNLGENELPVETDFARYF